MEKKRVAYYNMPGDIEYERKLLQEWKVKDMELVQVNDSASAVEEVLEGYQGLVTEYTILSGDILQKLPELKIIALQSIGYDEIDVQAARRLGIDVTNAPGYCAEEVANHAMALLLNLTRKISFYDRQVHSGDWNPFAGYRMHRLSGRTAGLVSFGNIPQKLAPMLLGFGISVLAYDPVKDAEMMKGYGVKKCETLETLLEESDYIFLHTPLIPDTMHMINRESFRRMKRAPLLINVSRGGLVDEQALIEALENGQLSGAGLDVLENEENRTTRLLELPNVVITPHAAFLSEESLKQSRRMALEQLVQKLSMGQRPRLLVNG